LQNGLMSAVLPKTTFLGMLSSNWKMSCAVCQVSLFDFVVISEALVMTVSPDSV
jgi:hypothetical protein